jgi:hypothetical protein
MDHAMLIAVITASVVFILLVVIKTIRFPQSTKRRTIWKWLYFTNYDIINSSSSGSEKAKQSQNKLSALLLGWLLLSLLVLAVIKINT